MNLLSPLLINVPGQNAVWRYDQIAAIELTDDTVKITPVNGFTLDERTDYEYEDEDAANEAFAQMLAAWSKAME